MLREMCKSKIHRARVTDANLEYEGSLTIDYELMKEADLLPYEKIHVLNINNGTRSETYVIQGASNSGEIVANGALARHVQPNDLVIILAYSLMDDEEAKKFKTKVVYVDKNNKSI